jgi:hypothetical protein
LNSRTVINVTTLRIKGAGESYQLASDEETKEAQHLYKQVMIDFAEGYCKNLLDLTTEAGRLEGYPIAYPSLMLGVSNLELDSTSDMVNDSF